MSTPRASTAAWHTLTRSPTGRSDREKCRCFLRELGDRGGAMADPLVLLKAAATAAAAPPPGATRAPAAAATREAWEHTRALVYAQRRSLLHACGGGEHGASQAEAERCTAAWDRRGRGAGAAKLK